MLKMNCIREKLISAISIYIILLSIIGIASAEGKWMPSDILVNGEKLTGLDDIYFVDKYHGWIVGSAYGDERLILHTSDGGRTWQRQSKESKRTHYLFVNRGIHFANSQNGWIVGDEGIILHTSTGGLVWQKQETGMQPLNIRGVKMPVDLFGVHFVDHNNGWAVGGVGAVIYTENGGLTWKKQRSGTTEILWGISCIDKDNCWAVGSRGTIVHTSSGGNKLLGMIGGWKKQESGTGADLYGVHFVDKDNGWAVGVGGLTHTSNGGKTWETQVRFNKTVLYKVFFVNKNKGWAVGSDLAKHTGEIKHTTDGGKTWFSQSIGTSGFTSVYFIDENHGWIVGPGTILRYEGAN
jgi:photosystem II stability/assembly factor-like uncharacterized protein